MNLPATTCPAAPAVTTVAGYLLTRLEEAGVISVFGLPPLLQDLARVLAETNQYSRP
jgi:hypothetical protein